MSLTVQLRLEPMGRTIETLEGSPLQDGLFAQGVEFPCGGRGRCRGCRVQVKAGEATPTVEDRARFADAELEAGWRLACRMVAREGLIIELAQWEGLILADESSFDFAPRDGLGVAVDVGTTTVVAQLIDLRTARVLGVATAWNDQARHGADLMSRLDFALGPDGAARLKQLIRDQVGGLIGELTRGPDRRVPTEGVTDIVLVGNTVMHHLFGGLPVDRLAVHPFEPATTDGQTFAAGELGWGDVVPASARVRFLPCLGSFVGSDILAGILATRLHESAGPAVLVDLGTNGEIVLGNRDRMLCASTAAGPAFEGARIGMGMRAATGAISEVGIEGNGFRCTVLGGGSPRGLCGSGLVDAVAAGLDLGLVTASGRLLRGEPLRLTAPVEVTQRDVRELQLAKGAIAAGLQLLARQWGTALEEVGDVHLAGAFGNYINRASARRIGLLPFTPDKVRAAGNTALLGAKLALFGDGTDGDGEGLVAGIRQRTTHVSLSEDSEFMDTYAREMGFPAG